MSTGDSQVKLYGLWSSPYVYRVIWALKLKGVSYEYMEEDLSNKSPALLEYNPVHKKVPVLVHCGKAMAESSIILQYIEETWPDHQNLLLPSDPFGRAMARFWIEFGHQMVEMFKAFFQSTEEDKEKKADRVLEMLRTVQDRALGDKKFFNGDRIGVVDLLYGWVAGPWFEYSQEIMGVRILDKKTLPKLHQWTVDFRQEQVIKENLPDYEAMFVLLKRHKAGLRHRAAKSPRTSTVLH